MCNEKCMCAMLSFNFLFAGMFLVIRILRLISETFTVFPFVSY